MALKLESVLNSVGLVPSWVSWASYHRAIVPSRDRNFLSSVFSGYKVFSRGCFVGLNLFSWVFRGSKMFPRVCFVGNSRIDK